MPFCSMWRLRTDKLVEAARVAQVDTGHAHASIRAKPTGALLHLAATESLQASKESPGKQSQSLLTVRSKALASLRPFNEKKENTVEGPDEGAKGGEEDKTKKAEKPSFGKRMSQRFSGLFKGKKNKEKKEEEKKEETLKETQKSEKGAPEGEEPEEDEDEDEREPYESEASEGEGEESEDEDPEGEESDQEESGSEREEPDPDAGESGSEGKEPDDDVRTEGEQMKPQFLDFLFNLIAWRGGVIGLDEWNRVVVDPYKHLMWPVLSIHDAGKQIERDDFHRQWHDAVNDTFVKLGGSDDNHIDKEEIHELWGMAPDYEKAFIQREFLHRSNKGHIDTAEFGMFLFTAMVLHAIHAPHVLPIVTWAEVARNPVALAAFGGPHVEKKFHSYFCYEGAQGANMHSLCELLNHNEVFFPVERELQQDEEEKREEAEGEQGEQGEVEAADERLSGNSGTDEDDSDDGFD